MTYVSGVVPHSHEPPQDGTLTFRNYFTFKTYEEKLGLAKKGGTALSLNYSLKL